MRIIGIDEKDDWDAEIADGYPARDANPSGPSVEGNLAAEDDQDSATVSPTAADLSLTKTVNDAAANVGDNVTFTITVSNAGPDIGMSMSKTSAITRVQPWMK